MQVCKFWKSVIGLHKKALKISQRNGKWRLLNYVPYVLSCLMPHVRSCNKCLCFTCLVPHVPRSLRALVSYVLWCPMYLVPYVLSRIMSFVPYVLLCSKCLVPYVSRVLCGLMPHALWPLFPYVPYCQYYFEVAISIYQQYDISELFETKYENIYIRNFKLIWCKWRWI